MEYITKEEFNNFEKRLEKRFGSRIKALEEKISDGAVAKNVKKRPESLNEFLNRKNLESGVDKTICIVYFLEVRRNSEGVTSKDIVDGFKEARYTVPSNTSDYLAKCAKKGFIQECGKRDSKKVWTLTNTGIKHVEDLEKEKEE